MDCYPKLPHLLSRDGASLSNDAESLLQDGELYVLEKLDGSNFRWMLYDERFTDRYPDSIAEFDPDDGDIIWGSRTQLRGTDSIPKSDISGNFWNAVTFLRDTVDRDAIRSAHDEYGCLIFFGENMVQHSLSYDWDRVPPVLGFDVKQADSGRFLSVMDAKSVLESSQTSFVPVVNGPIPVEEFDPYSVEVPESEFRQGVAEGVVLRNDVTGTRAKYVSDSFRERMYDRWGTPKNRAESGAEMVVATYCTDARIRKQVLKMVNDEGRDLSMHLMEDLRIRVVDDIWEENWEEIIRQNWTVDMSEVWTLTADRCRAVLQAMVTNHELSGASPDNLWEGLD